MNLFLTTTTPRRLFTSLTSLSAFVSFNRMSHVNRLLISTNSQQKIKVSDVMINFEKVGVGSHPILCLPGALGSIDTDFRPQITNLNEGKFSVVVWDPPGYGRSRPPDRDFSGGAQIYYRDAKLVECLMRELKFGQYSLLGWSDGGITALILSALFPDTVRKMVIWGANAFIHEKDCDFYKRIQDIDNWSPNLKNQMIELYGEKYFRETWFCWVNTCLEIYQSGGDICKDLLDQIKCPTLIIHGKLDPMVGLDHAEYLHNHIKKSRLIIMEDGKHNLHLRHFHKFNSIVEEFLSAEIEV